MKQALAGYENKALPVMPATLAELQRQLAGNNANNPALQATLMRDPGATIAVYRQLEQTRPGASNSIASTAHALAMIGREPLQRLMSGLETVGERVIDGRLSPAYAYSQAAHAACYASALSEKILSRPDDEVAVAALLQNPAILALWHRDFESAARASNAVRDGLPPDLAFAAELGEPLDVANRRLAEAWHLPRMAREAMGDWDPFNRRLQLVSVADMLASAAAIDWEGEQARLQSEILEDLLEVELDTATAWWHRAAADAARHLNGLGYPLPAYDMLLLPGDEPEIEVPEFGRRPRPSPPPPPARPAGAPDLQTVIADIMHRMQREAGVRRTVFAMLNRDRTELRARIALGGSAQDPVRRFRLRTAERNLFTLLLEKQQSIWINPDNRTRYAAYLRGIPQDAASAPGFYAMSIFVRDKPLGLMYADGGKTGEEGYKQFRQLCQQVARQLDPPRETATAGG